LLQTEPISNHPEDVEEFISICWKYVTLCSSVCDRMNETIIFLIRHPNAVRQVLKHLVRIPLSDIRVKPVQIGSLY